MEAFNIILRVYERSLDLGEGISFLSFFCYCEVLDAIFFRASENWRARRFRRLSSIQRIRRAWRKVREAVVTLRELWINKKKGHGYRWCESILTECLRHTFFKTSHFLSQSLSLLISLSLSLPFSLRLSRSISLSLVETMIRGDSIAT